MENFKEYSDAALTYFKAGYDAARAKTSDFVKKEKTPKEKGILAGIALGLILVVGILIGFAIGKGCASAKCDDGAEDDFDEYEDYDDYEDFEDDDD